MQAKIIIASPLQLINAIEARDYYNIDSIDITFFCNGNKNNKKQVLSVIEKLNIKAKILLITIPKDKRFFKTIFFLKSLKFYKKNTNNYDFVILGHFRSIYQATYANFYTGKKILVDDGTRSLDDISFLNNAGYKTFGYFTKRLFYRMFSVKPYLIAKKYTFFSYYTPKHHLGNHIDLIKNKFSFINKINGIKKDIITNKKIAFVGQSLVDTKLLTLDNYLKLINGIDNYYKNKYDSLVEIEYYPHRNESNEILEHINKMPNFRIMRTEFPLELYFLLSSEYPKEIGLFFSSVSETLSIVFENKLNLTSFYILPSDLLHRESEIESLYKNYRVSKNILLIENYIDS